MKRGKVARSKPRCQTTHYRICRIARIRAGNQTKAAAVAAFSRDIDFGHFWRQLRAAGWVYKRPKGIETKRKYVCPDGAMVLVGEEAVVAYVCDSGLLEEEHESLDEAPEDEATAIEEEEMTGEVPSRDCETPTVNEASAAEEEEVTGELLTRGCETLVGMVRRRSSVADRYLHPIIPAYNERFIWPPISGSTGSVVELSMSAVSWAFGLLTTELKNAATNRPILSEASGEESDLQPDSAPVITTYRVLCPRLQVKEDVNFVPDVENISEYESFCSGESNGDVDVDNDDDDVSSRYDPDLDATTRCR
ncbi:unnamed protein product [Phytophthora fragariaefolia]|uniref:Unnamed protein product n=1 Tax=Phytophthora fragariaefolia TaxID=1490495 RepID=A0A9W7D0M2_9STRA|nr:unnamed protein product [Phytophthora fragariaefolia]